GNFLPREPFQMREKRVGYPSPRSLPARVLRERSEACRAKRRGPAACSEANTDPGLFRNPHGSSKSRSRVRDRKEFPADGKRRPLVPDESEPDGSPVRKPRWCLSEPRP